jgi:Xaa-Pro aminopeptidase
MWENEVQEIDFAGRRKAFLSKIKDGVAVFAAAPELVRNSEVRFPYRQDSNFYYLTGFEEPHSICLLSCDTKASFQIFARPRDPKRELWDGKILGPEGAKSRLGADVAFPSAPESYFDEAFIEAIRSSEKLYYRVGVNLEFDRRIFRLLEKAACLDVGRRVRPLWPIVDPETVLGEMRLVKSRAEIGRLQMAAHISSEAHSSAMRIAKPGMFEYEVEAVLQHAFRINGARRLGYSTVVASGPNACVLHYASNNRRMNEQDLLLVDAGAEYDYYTADITRAYPVGGKFTQEQREVYLSVLKAQKECISLARPGKTLGHIHDCAIEILTEELRRLKILRGTTQSLLKRKAFAPYFPHLTSHWLGMDVYDAGGYFLDNFEHERKLQPGIVFTIGPGLYFNPEISGNQKYKGIGVRIEDDILITNNGCKVLTYGVPKEIDEVESICTQV